MTERLVCDFKHDPLGAVLYGFPWGEGELSRYQGPRVWQREVLEYIGKHFQNPETRDQVCRVAIASGHGTGKTTEIALLSWWGQSTFLDAMIRVTANTDRQLKGTTQPEFSRWYRTALNADDFNVNMESIKAADPVRDNTWRLDFVPWSMENPQAFAGKHNAGRRMFVVFEEASEIPDEIWRVANGALMDADTEKVFIAIGNPTRNYGMFYEAVFGNQKHRWKSWILDSRKVEGTNVEEIQSWLDECGGDEDHDYFRVRARGLFPKGGSGQFIDLELISGAQKRRAVSLPDDPLVAGCDFAWGGDDDNVIRFRKGLNARIVPPIKVKGVLTAKPDIMVGRVADVLTRSYDGEKVHTFFMDDAGIAAPIYQRLRDLGFKNIIPINFGGHSPHPKYAYMRDYMWGMMKDWLVAGGAIDSDTALAHDLGKPQLVGDRENRIKLESKDVMKARLSRMGIESGSPDDGDALALTFAHPIAPKALKPKPARPASSLSAWS